MNELSGTIPLNLFGIHGLEWLSLRFNNLEGELPPEIGRLKQIKALFLSDNQLSGHLPSELGDLENLIALHLDDNEFTGEFPLSLAQLTNLSGLSSITLSGNNLTGCAPRLFDRPEFQLGDLEFCGDPPTGPFAAQITLCSNGTALPAPWSNPELVNDCAVLLASRDTLSGQAVLNWTEEKPIDEWEGIGIAGDPQRVHVLDLGFRYLDGIVPPELGQLDALVDLNLTDNRLTGTIPLELSNLTNLNRLKLSVNLLDGSIPAELGQLTKLTDLDLGQNLFTGRIPEELGDLNRLSRLILGANRLSGEMPDSLNRLEKLAVAHLDRNWFDGCVPTRIRNADYRIDDLLFCDDPNLWRLPEIVFGGGPDLTVAYVERLPRYPRYDVAYDPQCHPEVALTSAVLPCDPKPAEKRAPAPGDDVRFVVHIWNAGDTHSGRFQWQIDFGGGAEAGSHNGLEPGARDTVVIDAAWPAADQNLVLTATVDSLDDVDEIHENNNQVVDWVKGHTIGVYFDTASYDALNLAVGDGEVIQSPEYWVHFQVEQLNSMLEASGLEDRVRVEQLYLTDERHIPSELRRDFDGWWRVVSDIGDYGEAQHQDPPVIDADHIRELLRLLGIVDLHDMLVYPDQVLIPDANFPWQVAGCGVENGMNHGECFRFAEDVHDIVSGGSGVIGTYTAGALRSNQGHRRGYIGDYRYDTPEQTILKIVDELGKPVQEVFVSLYQLEDLPQNEFGSDPPLQIDGTPEFQSINDHRGIVPLPNRGVTGKVTATGHQLRPNPFGVIDPSGTNGLFLVEMLTGKCTDYAWLSIVDLNLAYWSGQTDEAVEAVFEITFQCPDAEVLERVDAGDHCTNGVVVPQPRWSRSMVKDCQTLMAFKNALDDSGKLDWGYNRPIHQWHGIDIDINPERITSIRLGNSEIAGTIPPEIGDLDALQVIDLGGNKLTGPIPAELLLLTDLRELGLGSNQLTGNIPEGLGDLTDLWRLELHHNSLTGPIPASIGNLRRLERLNLGDNKLSGVIPERIGSLGQLRSLSFSNNRLTGPIPDSPATSRPNWVISARFNIWNSFATG